jgi:hypothetical protein
VFTDEEAEAIRRKLAEGRSGPMLLRCLKRFCRIGTSGESGSESTRASRGLTHDRPALGEQREGGYLK